MDSVVPFYYPSLVDDSPFVDKMRKEGRAVVFAKSIDAYHVASDFKTISYALCRNADPPPESSPPYEDAPLQAILNFESDENGGRTSCELRVLLGVISNRDARNDITGRQADKDHSLYQGKHTHEDQGKIFCEGLDGKTLSMDYHELMKVIIADIFHWRDPKNFYKPKRLHLPDTLHIQCRNIGIYAEIVQAKMESCSVSPSLAHAAPSRTEPSSPEPRAADELAA